MREDLVNILAKAAGDTAVFSKTFFPDRFHRDFDPIHYQLTGHIDVGEQKTVVAAPRGIGKTSFSSLSIPAKAALFGTHHFICPVSANATSAQQQSENLKLELHTNPIVRKLFGEIRTEINSVERWVVKTKANPYGTMIMPRGTGQQMRGLLYKDKRPDLILPDDFEDPQKVNSEEQRQKLKEWFFADVMNCVDRASDNWRIIFVGTLLHEDSLLAHLLEDPNWHSVVLEICNDQMKSNAPSMLSDKDIVELEQQYRDAGEIDVFYREYRNKVISTKDAGFQASHFRYYDETEVDFSNHEFETVVLVDPAKTVGKRSKESAVVTISVNLLTNAIYIRDPWGEKVHPDELFQVISDRLGQYNARTIGVEETSLHEFIRYPLLNELTRTGVDVDYIPLTARGGSGEAGKISRIKALIPFYRKGLIFHNKQNCGKLEGQLMSFPRAKLWDVMDATAYIVEMLDKGDRFMREVREDDYEETQKSVEDEYAGLYGDYGNFEELMEDFQYG